jgi:hypothetical protein
MLKDRVRKEWRRMHNEELYHLYCSPYIIQVIKSRKIRLTGHVARVGETRGADRILMGKPEEKRPLGKPRRRWKNIKTDIQEVGWGVAWTGLIWFRIGTVCGVL